MSKADGSVIIDVHVDTEGVDKDLDRVKKIFEGAGKEASDAGKEIEDVGKKSKKTGEVVGGDLVSSFIKLGKTLAASAVVGAVVDFGKECIELGSDLEEVQNVVDVTFETMSDDVNQFARDAQKSAGLSEKMAKQYVGTFGAMADSFGFTETEAYEMSTALTQLTGDVASFYNLSQDEAMNKLKGVFTGETEALKELGVVMTQTALDNYALANGFGKTTAQMTEQEKVALRYQFVMDQLSAASGDFVRTQDSWANQTKVLSLQWESLMATLGSGLIDALLPGIQFLNDTVLPALQEFGDKFAEALEPKPSDTLRKSIKKLESSMEDIEGTYQDTAKEIDKNALLAAHYADKLKALEASGLDTAEAQREYANAVSQINAIYPDLNLRINSNTGYLDANSRAMLANIEVMKQKALFAAQEARYNELLTAQADAIIAIQDAEYALMGVQGEKEVLQQMLTESTGKTIEQLVELYNTQTLANNTMQAGGEWAALNASLITLMGDATEGLTNEQMELVAQMIALGQEEVRLNQEIANGNEVVAGYDAKLNDLDATYNTINESTGDLSNGQQTLTVDIEKTSETLETLQKEYEGAKNSARSSIDSQVGLFDELVIKSDKSAADIVANWESQRIALDKYKDNMDKAIKMGLDEALVKQLSDGSTESMAILDEFVNGTDIDVDEINAAFRKTEESKETVSATMADIQTDMSEKLAALEKEVSDSYSAQANQVKSEIAKMQWEINSLQGKTVTIRRNYVTSYSTYGSPDAGTSSYSVASADVPYLASGAVIPPNAPFMAVLGDQRHGTNIEAPLSTIQEAVATVMADQTSGMMRGFEALLEENRMLREAVENIQVGDDVLGRAVGRYNRHMNVINGGNL